MSDHNNYRGINGSNIHTSSTKPVATGVAPLQAVFMAFPIPNNGVCSVVARLNLDLNSFPACGYMGYEMILGFAFM